MAAEWRRTWGDTFFSRRAGHGSAAMPVLRYPPFQRVAAERGAAAGGEQRAGGPPAAFGEPRAQDRHGGGGERGDALLSAFAQADVRAGSQVDVADGQAGELGGAQPGLAGQHQQGLVAPAGPGVQVGGCQQGRDLFLGEVGDQGLVVRLGGIARTRAMSAACSGWRSAA
jgi:hypothetical protein